MTEEIPLEPHHGQLEEAYKPYILHPLQAMMSMESESPDSVRVGAVLHDVVKDSEWTVEKLDEQFALATEEQAALRFLPRWDEEHDDSCMEQVATSQFALAVNVVDLRDSLDGTHPDAVTERDAKRISECVLSLRWLTHPAVHAEVT